MRFFLSALVCSILLTGCTKVPTNDGETKIEDAKSIDKKMKSIVWEEMSYEYAFYEVDTNKVELILNLPEKRKTREILRREECASLINGGFYGKNEEPIGWMVNDSKEYSRKSNNILLNGFVSLDATGKVMIGSGSVANPTHGVQTGPILISSGKKVVLKINNDVGRRRMVAAKTNEGKLVFMVVIEPKSRLTGPRLGDMPSVVEKIGEENGYVFESAINLDGGSASAYYDGTIHIEEANPVGSYFCVRP